MGQTGGRWKGARRSPAHLQNEKHRFADCRPSQGLIREGEDMIKETAPASVKDAGLIAAAQRVEHYEISGYGTAV
ncbi:MAG: DUF892 family protein, partial [Verrucomicrobiales bacterium]|nr:DUF892 family protein [Verrucomicrobiales bacterium]